MEQFTVFPLFWFAQTVLTEGRTEVLSFLLFDEGLFLITADCQQIELSLLEEQPHPHITWHFFCSVRQKDISRVAYPLSIQCQCLHSA